MNMKQFRSRKFRSKLSSTT